VRNGCPNRTSPISVAKDHSVIELLLILAVEDQYFVLKEVEAALAGGGFATEGVASGRSPDPLHGRRQKL
jgi:hypothetical protein